MTIKVKVSVFVILKKMTKIYTTPKSLLIKMTFLQAKVFRYSFHPHKPEFSE